MLFLTLFWFVSLTLFLLAPVLCSKKRRRRWWRRIRYCTCRPDRLEGGDRNDNNRNSTFRYVLSQEQEDDIRESFLMSKLQAYTVTLQPEMVAAVGRTAITTTTPSHNADIEMGTAHDQDLDVANPKDDDDPNKKDNSLDSADEEEETGDVDTAGKIVGLPPAGQPRDDVRQSAPEADNNNNLGSSGNETTCTRQVPNSCAICLSALNVAPNADTSNTNVKDADVENDQDDLKNSEDKKNPEKPNNNKSSSDDNNKNNIQICWSSNPACQHVFHETCILDWLQATGSKHWKKLRREQQPQQQGQEANDAILDGITNFPTLCPCCRQDFISPDAVEEATKSLQASSNIGDPRQVPEGADQTPTNPNPSGSDEAGEDSPVVMNDSTNSQSVQEV
mmetsp:Transcript_29498/g.81076  ORF Transcript_29498/g.81076 Transcript_29498/m.81076 type:complete len:392 (-) Transcript_29498:75-1250(-)|eukprot:CAMPEP_0168734144 /NCGR_PEP_ID=MMETSP0724-20121128/8659_1 /TAXON_ID=265536 /ORGANISM="Amphiprora sp., Strain CCMP467" /LENGTH=391 /DNA_ID=CAMNT_0008781233 /DNA_START=138 /DNA_END=1313 /DNA_ORIENTATION=+